MSLTKRRFWISLLVGTLLTALFCVIGVLANGGGHSLTVIISFFPYASALGLLLEDTGWDLVAMIPLLLQFPLYAIILTRVKGVPRRVLVLLSLIIVHVLGAMVGLRIYRSSEARISLYKLNQVNQVGKRT